MPKKLLELTKVRFEPIVIFGESPGARFAGSPVLNLVNSFGLRCQQTNVISSAWWTSFSASANATWESSNCYLYLCICARQPNLHWHSRPRVALRLALRKKCSDSQSRERRRTPSRRRETKARRRRCPMVRPARFSMLHQET